MAGTVLVPSGRFAFSVEAVGGDGYHLTAGYRYAHSDAYLRRIIAEAGLVAEAVTETTCRLEAGLPLSAFLVVARKPEDETGQHDVVPTIHMAGATAAL